MKAHLIIGIILIAICSLGIYYCVKELIDNNPRVEDWREKENKQ